jgi:LDH2 family malate/lactate/ureidoglycolate dehydrogenase
MPVEEFKRRMDDFIAMCKSAKKRPGVDEILVPGEQEYRREQHFRQHGALLDEAVFDRLRELAGELGIPFPFERT